MELNVICKGLTETGEALEIGDKVKYIYHIPGGMVKIEMPDGTRHIAHPLCFKELR